MCQSSSVQDRTEFHCHLNKYFPGSVFRRCEKFLEQFKECVVKFCYFVSFVVVLFLSVGSGFYLGN